MDKLANSRWRHFWISVFPGVLLLCGLAHGVAEKDETSRYGGEYRAPLKAEPTNLDPAYFTDIHSMNVAENLFDGLVAFDQNLNVVPAIARRWKISRDHRTYTFILRKGVKFHNGREVTAKDAIFSFTRILSPKTQSPVASFFLEIQGARAFHEGESPTISGLSASSPYTLKIELERPFAPFLSILAMANAKVVPEEAINSDFGKRPIGTGPFRFQTWQPGKMIRLEANESYFAGRPYLDTLSFRIYQNEELEKIFSDFEQGLLDQSIIPSNKFEQVISDASYRERYNLVSKPLLNLVYLGMNTSMAPFDDPRVRQAVNYAVDREEITRDITKRGSLSAKSILPPGVAGFDPNFQGYPYDKKRARELLAEAGYPNGEGIAPIEIWTVSTAESVQKELQAYKRYLAEVGVQLVPRIAENWKEFLRLINEKKVAMFYAAWYADYPDPDNFLYVLFHSSSKINRMGYNNAEVDALLEQGREETDYMKRAELYQLIQERVMRDAPVISQHINSSNYLFQPWVNGIELSNLGATYLPFRNIWLETDEFTRVQSASQGADFRFVKR